MDILKWEMKMSDMEGRLNKKIESFLKEIKEEIIDCKRSMDFISNNFETFKEEIVKMNENQNLLNKENERLNNDIKNIKRQMERFEEVIEDFEYDKIKDTIELSMVQGEENENLDELMLKIFTVSEVQLGKANIKKVYRKKSKRNGVQGDVVLKPDSSVNKVKLLKAIKNKRLTNKQIGFVKNPNSIFAKEMLTRLGKDLYYKSLSFKKANNWKFIWTNEGRIFLRKAEGEKYFKINSEQDLLKMEKNVKS